MEWFNLVKLGSLDEETPFGRVLLPYFQLDPSVTNINHGSLGAPPIVVGRALRHYQRRIEKFPDEWFRYENGPEQSRVIEELKEYVHATDPSANGRGVGDLVLVRNATFAMNSILRSWHWRKGDKLLLFNHEYEMTKLATKFLAETFGVLIVQVHIKFPISNDEVVNAVSQALGVHGSDTKLATFSHILPMPAVILPIKRIIDLCRSANVPAVIDGAHALGQIEVSIADLDPDFYIACGHKWLFAAKGVAFLYVKKRWRSSLHPAVITYGYGDPDARKEFKFAGNGDYAPYFTISTALQFRRSLGEQRIREYFSNLSMDAGKLMAGIWRTDVLIENENQLCAMNNVRLPLPQKQPTGCDADLVQCIVKELYSKYKTFMNTFEHEGVWYARISASIYNEISDFRMVANRVLEIVWQLSKKECFHKSVL